MKKKNIPLTLSAVVCVIALAVMFWTLTKPAPQKKMSFTPPPFEVMAVSGVPDVPEELGWGQLDAKVYKASLCGVLRVEEGKIDVWFSNPESNTVWLKLRILDAKGNILGETGIIKSGEYVRSVVMDLIPRTGENVVLKLMGYEPETYHSAGTVTLNTTIAE